MACPVCDSLGNYIQYNSSSVCAQPRVWTRETTANIIFPEKVKYYVLKNPPSTVRNVPQLITCKNNKTVVVGNKTFVIDSKIYDSVVAKLDAAKAVGAPVTSLEGLRAVIAESRAELNIPAPISVQLANVPLNIVPTVKTYNSIGDTWQSSKLVSKNTVGSFFKYGNFVSSLFDTFSTTLPYLNFWQGKFNIRDLNLKKAQYFYAQQNDGCSYSSTFINLFTTALRSGSTILPPSAISLYNSTGIIYFDPFPSGSTSLSLTLCFILSDMPVKPGTFPARFGAIFVASPYWVDRVPETPYNGSDLRTLIRAEIKANSELIFIPILSDLDLIEYVPVASGTGFYIPVTNGGVYTTKITLLFNLLKNQFADTLTLQNQDYSFSTNFQS